MTVTTVTGGMLQLTWVVPKDDGGGSGITGYQVEISNGTCPNGATAVPPATATCFTVGNAITLDRLAAGTVVSASVSALNGVGASLATTVATFQTLPTLTHAREPMLHLVAAAAGTATIDVDLPADMGGADTGRLRVYARKPGSPAPFVSVLNEVAVDRDGPRRLEGLQISNLFASTTYELIALVDTGVPDVTVPGMLVTAVAGSNHLDVVSSPTDASAWAQLLRVAGTGLVVAPGTGPNGHSTAAVTGSNALPTLEVGSTLNLARPFNPSSVGVTAVPVALSAARSPAVLLTTIEAGKPALVPAPAVTSTTGGSLTIYVDGPLDTGGLALESFTLRISPANAGNNTRLQAHAASSPAFVLGVTGGALPSVVASDVTALPHKVSAAAQAGVFVGTFTASVTVYDLPSDTAFDITAEAVSSISRCIPSDSALRPATRAATPLATPPTPPGRLV